MNGSVCPSVNLSVCPSHLFHHVPFMVYNVTIIIVKNIRYLLWNRGAWCSLNNTYQTFLAPCIRCTDHLCDSCALSDINQHHYYNCEKYPLSPLKPRCLVLIEQYLPNISGPVYSVHRSFMWFMCLKWHRSTFYPITDPDDFKMLTCCDDMSWPLAFVMSQWPIVLAGFLWTLSYHSYQFPHISLVGMKIAPGKKVFHI